MFSVSFHSSGAADRVTRRTFGPLKSCTTCPETFSSRTVRRRPKDSQRSYILVENCY